MSLKTALSPDGLIFISSSAGTDNEVGRWEIDPDDKESIQFRIPKEKFELSANKLSQALLERNSLLNKDVLNLMRIFC